MDWWGGCDSEVAIGALYTERRVRLVKGGEGVDGNVDSEVSDLRRVNDLLVDR